MKFFMTVPERKKAHTTCCFEFQRGKYCGKHWLADSVCLHADIFDEFHLYRFFSTVIPSFAYYGPTEVSEENWQKLLLLFHEHGGIEEELILELVPWVEECFKTEEVFTVCGI